MWRHNIFLRTTYIHNKYMYTIRAYHLQYCGRRRRTMDAGHRTMDAGPSTPYYKLTGELKSSTEEKFNEKTIKYDHSKKTPRLYLMVRTTHWYLSVTLPFIQGFDAACFQNILSGLQGKILHGRYEPVHP